jgi:6-phosphogluconolactonase
MNGRLEIFRALPDVVRECTHRIVSVLNEEVRQKGTASFVLSGGTTPRSVYEALGADDARDRVEWAKVHLFWGDERCVPPSMPESNYRMAHEALIAKIGIPERNVHRIPAERSPQEAAHLYQAELKKVFSLRERQLPAFTLILLGLGEDGHTASLFPDTSAFQEHTRLVAEVYVESFKSSRITMTLPVINAALNVMFIVAGKGKASILREVLEGDIPRYPASLVNPSSGLLSWFVDRDAASQLQILNKQ